MAVSPFDSAIFGDLLSDHEIAGLFGDGAEIRALLTVEAALAKAEARAGVIPKAAGERIAELAGNFAPDPEALAAATARDGMPLPALVAALREAAADDGRFVHWGGTSQDVMDTALVLRLRDAFALLDQRLAAIAKQFAVMADRHRATVMAARTRFQQAAPTTFGLKAAGWLSAIERHRTRLKELSPRVLVLSFGGAAGTLAALGDKALEVEAGLSEVLDLPATAVPWHAQRDGLAEVAGWCALVTGTLGKFGQDVIMMSQNEVGELRPAKGGGSSTLPNKKNPVAAEMLLTLARFNAGLVSNMHHAAIHTHERDGAAWTLEWLNLPQMVVATAAALNQAQGLIETLDVDPVRMRANLDAANGLLLAEAASFALSAHMPLQEAKAVVKDACAMAASDGRHLADVLRETSPAEIDWDQLKDPAAHLGAAEALIERALQSSRNR